MTALQVKSRFGNLSLELSIILRSMIGLHRDVLTEILVDRGSGYVVNLSSFPPGPFGADPMYRW